MKDNSSSTTLVDRLRGEFATLEAGSRVPTMRDVANRHHVSVFMVQRAFDVLKEEGLIQSFVGARILRDGRGHRPVEHPWTRACGADPDREPFDAKPAGLQGRPFPPDRTPAGRLQGHNRQLQRCNRTRGRARRQALRRVRAPAKAFDSPCRSRRDAQVEGQAHDRRGSRARTPRCRRVRAEQGQEHGLGAEFLEGTRARENRPAYREAGCRRRLRGNREPFPSESRLPAGRRRIADRAGIRRPGRQAACIGDPRRAADGPGQRLRVAHPDSSCRVDSSLRRSRKASGPPGSRFRRTSAS